MNKLTFRVAVEQNSGSGYRSFVPGLMVCGTGQSIEEALENTKTVIVDYMPDSIAAGYAFGSSRQQAIRDATWHTIEIIR